MSTQQAEEITHTGIHHARTEQEHNLLELLFAQAWEDRNDACLNCPDIHGTLDYILSTDSANPDVIPQRDATVAATVIQWLGTKVGMDFILDVLVQVCAQHQNNIGHRFFESFFSCLKEASPDSYEILRSHLLSLLS